MSIRVKSLQLGFYGTRLRPEGDEFDIKDESELGTWMEVQDVDEPGPKKGGKGKTPKPDPELEPVA